MTSHLTPDEVAERRVLADRLLEDNDVRGELINAMLDGKPWTELLVEHAEALNGSLGHPILVGDELWEPYHSYEVRARWIAGFIDGLQVPLNGWGQDEDIVFAPEQLLHPSLRHLRELVLSGAMHEEAVTLPPCPSVKKLRIGAFAPPEECEMSWSRMGDWDLATAFPNVRELYLQGGFDSVRLPASVERFTLETSTAQSTLVQSLLAQLKGCPSITLWTGDTEYGCDVSMDDIAPLLTYDSRHLGLVNCEFVGEFLAALANSPVLTGLRTLDLSMGVLTDDEAEVLLAHASAFEHIQRIDLRENLLVESTGALREAFGERVLVDNQRDHDPGLVYVAVGE